MIDGDDMVYEYSQTFHGSDQINSALDALMND